MSDNLSLDETLKELMDDTAEASTTPSVEAAPAPEKPKRTRRTKAQIEKDKQDAEKAASAQASAEKHTVLTEEQCESLLTAATDSKDETHTTIVESVEPEDVKLEDTSIETVSTVETSIETVEELEPEVIENTEQDEAPDVVEPDDIKEKKEKTAKPFEGATTRAVFEGQVKKCEVDPIVGRNCIFHHPVPVYRAPHLNMRIRSYRGHVTVIDKPRKGFVKVQYLRQGFGLCEGFIRQDQILGLLEGESGETQEG